MKRKPLRAVVLKKDITIPEGTILLPCPTGYSGPSGEVTVHVDTKTAENRPDLFRYKE